MVKGKVKNTGLKDVKDVIITGSCPECLTELPLDGWNAVRWDSLSGVKLLLLGDVNEELDQMTIKNLPYQEEAPFEVVAAAKLIGPALLSPVIPKRLTPPPGHLQVKVKSYKPAD